MVNEKKTHLDLFTGIGGFSLAIDNVWPNVEHTFCEIDPFCQQVLKKHWPKSKIYDDIRKLKGKRGSADIITGGFPCQPFSYAGERRGKNDDRYLWPEMLRVIREVHPRWVIAENVSGLITWNEGVLLEQIFTDLESEGYEVQPFIIPALSVNAPHRRERLWIVANSDGNGYGRQRFRKNNSKKRKAQSEEDKREWFWPITCGVGEKEYWIQTATELCREGDGIPPQLDRDKRRKALGNAIIPQVAEEIFKAIKAVTP